MSRLSISLTLLAAAVLVTGVAAGSTFRLELGPAVAGFAPGLKKNTAFAVRALACPQPGQVRITATAHTAVGGARQSSPVTLAALETPGAFAAAHPSWPRGTVGVVSLDAACGSTRAGAVVALGPLGFWREASRILDRTPSESDIAAALAGLQSATR